MDWRYHSSGCGYCTSADTGLSYCSVSLYHYTLIGGNFNILVTVFVQAGLGREWALLITFPGLYMLSSFLFIVTFFVLRCEIVKTQSNLYVSLVANSE